MESGSGTAGSAAAADVTAIGWFPSPRQVEPAVAAIRRRYTAGAPEAVAGSLLVPDVRVCGAAPPSTIAASAHELAAADGGAAIVLDLHARPPLHGMITRPVRVLPCCGPVPRLSISDRGQHPEVGGRGANPLGPAFQSMEAPVWTTVA